MKKNGKFFVNAPNDGSDFKSMFKLAAAAGAGRPVDKDGFPPGPWTPELLAEAISQIDGNRSSIDLRTVQFWFQENDKGVSATNLRWLARIFGCDDPVATSEWQIALSAAQAELAARRRSQKQATALEAPQEADVPVDEPESHSVEPVQVTPPQKRFSLARSVEALFGSMSHLSLSVWIFAGATALGFLSYFMQIHSVTYRSTEGVLKQVGFLWAPNWTVLFMVLLPMFLFLSVEMLTFWRHEGRVKLSARGSGGVGYRSWGKVVDSYSQTHWAVLAICIVFAGAFQWVGVRLLPLLGLDSNYATDWGTVALVKPELVSIPEAVIFTGLAYLYMCVSFYLLFAGLIFFYAICHDYHIMKARAIEASGEFAMADVDRVGSKVVSIMFRATILAVLISMCMKLQSNYLASDAGNILLWLLDDLLMIVRGEFSSIRLNEYSLPTQYSSLIVVVVSCFVYFNGVRLIGVRAAYKNAVARMSAVIAALVLVYLLIGAVPGFSLLLLFGVIVGAVGITDASFRRLGRISSEIA